VTFAGNRKNLMGCVAGPFSQHPTTHRSARRAGRPGIAGAPSNRDTDARDEAIVPGFHHRQPPAAASRAIALVGLCRAPCVFGDGPGRNPKSQSCEFGLDSSPGSVLSSHLPDER